MKRLFVAAVALMVLSSLPAKADEVAVAVAANFTEAAKQIAKSFAEKTGHTAVLSFGSTGQLYTQITQSAPFGVFLAADAARPAKAVKEGFGVDGSEFTYAVGKLVLWSKVAGVTAGEDALKAAKFDKVAIANPKTAPYGAAAVEVMKALGVYDTLEPKIVQGNSISQTLQFVDSSNAELGFVALSQVVKKDEGSKWAIPQDLYKPIRQDAVLLKPGADNAAAKAFIDFLKGADAGAIIAKFGYGTGK